MKNKLIVFLLASLLIITIGYALLSRVLNMNGTARILGAKYDIHFANVLLANDSIDPVSPVEINEEGNQIEFQVVFSKINTKFEFTTDIVNDGTLDGKITKIELTDLSSAESHLVEQSIYYTDTEEEPSVGDVLEAGDSINLTVRLKYDLFDDLTNEEYATITDNYEKTFKVRITYEAF